MNRARLRLGDRDAAEGRQIRYEIADPNLAHALRDLLEVVVATDCDR